MQPRWESIWRFLKKVKMELLYHSVIPLLCTFPKDSKSYYRHTCTPVFIAALVKIAKIWNQFRSPLAVEWMQIMVNIHN